MTEVPSWERVMSVLFGADETLLNIKFFARAGSMTDSEGLFADVHHALLARKSERAQPMIDFPERGDPKDVRLIVARI